jgi:hypothetical protein
MNHRGGSHALVLADAEVVVVPVDLGRARDGSIGYFVALLRGAG